MTRTCIPILLAAAALVGSGSPAQVSTAAQLHCTAVASHQGHVTIVPEGPSPDCGNGHARLYDECSDQFELLNQAKQLAKEENKVVLVSYGAEWCKWCHIFVDTVLADSKTDALNAFVSQSFVIVHIDATYATNGGTVLRKTGAARAYGIGLPFFYSLNDAGMYAAHIVNQRVLILRNQGAPEDGFDRQKLLADLKLLQARALGRSAGRSE